MSLDELLEYCVANGVRLKPVAGSIKINGNKKALNKDVIASIKQHKQSILNWLNKAAKQHDDLQIAPTGMSDSKHLSHAQRQFLFIESGTQQQGQYHVPLLFTLRGDVNLEALQKAFAGVLDKYQILRTCYQPSDDGHQTHLLDPKDIPLEICFAFENKGSSLKQHIQQQISLPFDLHTAAPVRACLYRVTSDEHWLFVNFHHIAIDGGSLPLVLNSLQQQYQYALGMADDNAINVSTTATTQDIQYQDFAKWQSENIATWKASSLSFWQQNLASAPARHGLPLKQNKTPDLDAIKEKVPARNENLEAKTPNSILQAFSEFDAQLSEQLQLAAKQNSLPLYSCVLALLSAFLRKVTQQQQIVMGVPFSGRSNPQLQQLVGCLVNTLPVHFENNIDVSLNQLLADTRQLMSEVMAQQHLPFEEVLQSLSSVLKIEREAGVNPLFQIALVPDDENSVSLQLQGLSCTTQKLNYLQSKMDLQIMLQVHENAITLKWIFDGQLLDESFVASMAEAFVYFTRQALTHTDKEVAALPMVAPDAAQAQLVATYRENVIATQLADIPYHSLFRHKAQQHPDAMALLDARESMTYQELDVTTDALARYMVQQGIKPGDVVGVLCERGAEYLVAVLSIFKAGAVYLPLDSSHPDSRLSKILTAAEPKLMLVQPHLAERECLYPLSCTNLNISGFRETEVSYFAAAHKIVLPEANANAPAYMIFTSGSTGTPKGVLVKHVSFVNLVLDQVARYNFSVGDRFCQFFSMAFDASMLEWGPALASGGALCIPGDAARTDPAKLVSFLNAHDVNMLVSTPGFLAELEPAQLPCVDIIMVGGEKFAAELANKWRTHCRVINVYGPTETTVITHQFEVQDGLRCPLGQPLSNIKQCIVDDYDNPVPYGAPGQLLLSGICVSEGYFGQQAMTDKVFFTPAWSTERYYKTGDLVRFDEQGCVEYLGRIDEQVKIRGYRVELGEIKNTILKFNDCVDAAVIVDQTQGSARLAAYVSMAESPTGSQQVPAELKEFVKKSLPVYMQPGSWTLLPKIPKTMNGKVDKRRLPAPDFNQSDKQNIIPVEGPMQQKLRDLWAEILGLESDQVGGNSDFFALGGHSLLAMRMVAGLPNLDLPCNADHITVADIIRHPILAQFAALLENDAREKGQQPASALTSLRATDKSSMATPATHQQARLWTLAKLNGQSWLYNIAYVWQLQGNLNVNVLLMALNEVLAQHSVLRNRFSWQDNRLMQQDSGINIEVHNRSLVQSELAGWSRDIRNHHFDLEQQVPIRVELANVADTNEWYLGFVVHHIVADGWSISLLLQQVSQRYQQRLTDTPEALHPAALTYHDFCWWQAENMNVIVDKELPYWQQKLTALPEEQALPFDFSRPDEPVFSGGVHTLSMTSELSQQLSALAVECKVSNFVLLQSLFCLLLSRYGQTQDIVLGTPVAGRDAQNLQDVTGFFANTLVLRNDLSKAGSFKDILDIVKTTFTEALAHQHLPFELLVDELKVPRQFGKNPIFQIVFAYLEGFELELDLPEVQCQPVNAKDSASKFDLTLTVSRKQDAFVCEWHYAAELFAAESIAQLAAHFETLCVSVAKQPNTALRQLNVFSTEQWHTLQRWNDSASTDAVEQGIEIELLSARLVDNYIEQVSLANANKTALVTDDRQIDYDSLSRRSNQMAHWLLSQGMGPGKLVAIHSKKSIDAFIAILAVLKSGAAYVPMDPEYPKDRLEHMLQDSGCSLLLSSEPNVEKELTVSSDVACYHLSHQAFIDSVNSRDEYQPDFGERDSADTAYVIYTSGSTGLPKGVALSHAALLNLVLTQKQRINPQHTHRILQFASLSFDASVWDWLLAFTHASALYIPSQEQIHDPALLGEYIHRHQISLALLPPVLLNYLERETCQSLQTLIVGGEATPLPVAQEWAKGREFINAYGPTEATVTSSMLRFSQGDTLSIGTPNVNYRYWVLDEHQQLMPLGAEGELCIAGEGLAKGYLNRPELNAEKFTDIQLPDGRVETVYRTGDKARWLPDGNMQYAGRIDHQVKINGNRIELGEIENQLLLQDSVQDAVVVVSQDNHSKQLVAFVCLSSGKEQSGELAETNGILLNQIREQLRQHLPAFMLPAHIHDISAIPMTPNGKADRKKLVSLAQQKVTSGSGQTVSTEVNDEPVLAVFSEVLGHSSFDLQGNFFANGGDSIKAVQLVAGLKEKGYVLSVRDVFNAQSLQAMLPMITKKSGEDSQSAINNDIDALQVGIDVKSWPEFDDVYPLSFAPTGDGGARS